MLQELFAAEEAQYDSAEEKVLALCEAIENLRAAAFFDGEEVGRPPL